MVLFFFCLFLALFFISFIERSKSTRTSILIDCPFPTMKFCANLPYNTCPRPTHLTSSRWVYYNHSKPGVRSARVRPSYGDQCSAVISVINFYPPTSYPGTPIPHQRTQSMTVNSVQFSLNDAAPESDFESELGHRVQRGPYCIGQNGWAS
jgi:hypothetical protein